MENVIHRLTLDLTGPDMCPMIEVQRGDSARSLIISLTQGGRPYWIEEGLTAALYATKPDGNPLFNACAIEKNRIRYDFTHQTANVAGAFDCEIWLVAGDKREMTTPRFTIAVDERMRTDDVIPESEPEYTAITEMVAAGTAMIEELREALAGLEGVEEILAQARVAAEAASNSEAAAEGHARTAEDAAADALGYAEDAEAHATAARKSEDNSRLNLHEAEVAAQEAQAAARRAEEAAANAGQGGGGAGLPADLFGGYDRFYRSIARGRVNPEEPLDVATYDGSGQLTHPCVRHFPEGFGGHSWWMTASPYPNSALELENPCVWYSDDGIHWSADGIPNPLDEPLYVTGEQASMNSDPHLLVRPDGVMEVWWRTNYWENSGEGLYTVVYRRTSTDGVNWTAKEELHRMLTNSADGIVCPVALYEDGVYKIWAVSDQECLRYYESATGADWRHIRDIDVSNPDYPEYKVWHFDIDHTDKGYEFVGNYCIPGDYTSHKYLYYAVSQDNITYSKRVMILTRGETGRFDERLVYRPTIVRMADRVRIYYGANNADNVWSIGLIEAPSAYLFNAVLISGARVGAIESGQEWLDGRVAALEAGGGGDNRPADEGVTVVRSFDESPWLPGYWDPSNDGELTLYSNMHRTQLVELASLTVDGELPEITATSSVASWPLVRFNYFNGNLEWIGFDVGVTTDPQAGTQEPTVLRWPAGAVYVAVSANVAEKDMITITGVPEGGDCEISDEQIREIAEVAAEMVKVPVGETVLLDTTIEIPADAPVTVLELEFPEAAKQFAKFYVELKSSEPTNSPANDIPVRFTVCGNELAGSSNGNGKFRKANETWVTATVDLLVRTVINATYNNNPEYNISSSMSIWKPNTILPVGKRSNVFKARLNAEYAGTLTVRIMGYG